MKVNHRINPGRNTSWSDLAGRFPQGRDCLASFLAMNCAEVVAGVKPANLLNIVGRTRRCGTNLLLLWELHGADLMAETELNVVELCKEDNRLLLLVFNSKQMQNILDAIPVQRVLTECGYDNPGSIPHVLDILKRRVNKTCFPHEIGVLLGYPLKDVLAFMGRINLPFTCQGPWRIYGDPMRSLLLADCYRDCRKNMAKRLNACITPIDCLVNAA
ncbi:DUF3793 family protein [Geobacter sp. DSM 9736]|uniref:DUF3793 family protein n=1 Tax=Geobacter sp. DSM 9736 TaxID=1277350 RepID=UPI000B502346|nr:DUF3793 family protein [Geobacter sp. DSM 9736]SNB45811.1 Protein of unknown function [Geobacter sp. DSM 9736]